MSNRAEITTEAPPTSNPLDVAPAEIPFDVPYGHPISLEQAQEVIHAAVAEAKKRDWKMNVAVADSGGNLVAFQRRDGAMLASIQIAQHKARAAVTFRRPTKVFEDGINLMHLNYLLAFDGVIASRVAFPDPPGRYDRRHRLFGRHRLPGRSREQGRRGSNQSTPGESQIIQISSDPERSSPFAKRSGYATEGSL
jgi:glc operon protein GlcG